MPMHRTQSQTIPPSGESGGRVEVRGLRRFKTHAVDTPRDERTVEFMNAVMVRLEQIEAHLEKLAERRGGR